MTHIIILSATPRSNMKLSRQIEQEVQALGMSAEVIDLEALNLPLYTLEQESQEIPIKAYELSDKLTQVEGLVFVGPEYNGGLTPVAVNTLNWVSRTGGDWRRCFADKMVLMASSSGGQGQNLFRVLSTQMQHLGAIVLPRPIAVNSSKSFNEEAARSGLQLIKRWSEGRALES